MSLAVRTPATHPEPERLPRRAISLGAANVLDYSFQFLLPVVLVRYLPPDDFGRYRLMWLVTGTVMALITQAMGGSLYYFLPRSDSQSKRLYINQALLYLGATGLLGAFAVSPWDPWLPQTVRHLTGYQAIVPLFVLLWVVTSLLDLIGTAEERVGWQIKVTIGLSALRAVALSTAAILTRRFDPLMFALLGFVIFKLGLLLGYVARHHGLGGPWLRKFAFVEQLKQSAPFGFAGALYGLRIQADQWVATTLFSVGMFASFSIAAQLAPLVNLCRQSVLQTFLPSISRLQAAGDIKGMLELNSRGNVMTATLVYPLLAFAFVFARQIVTIVYTPAYAAAAPVMRLYIIGLIVLVVEIATLMLLLRQGTFCMILGAIALLFSVTVSRLAARSFGLAGAAAGSVTAIYLDHLITLWRISRCTSIPMHRLQDWRSLGLLLASASVAGAITWVFVTYVLEDLGTLEQLAAGGALLAATYLVLVLRLNLDRGWLVALGGKWRELRGLVRG